MDPSEVLDGGEAGAHGAGLAGAHRPQPAPLALQVPAGHVQDGTDHSAVAAATPHPRPALLIRLLVTITRLAAQRPEDVGLGVLGGVEGLVGLGVGQTAGVAQTITNINIFFTTGGNIAAEVVCAVATLALHADSLPPFRTDPLEALPPVLEVAGAGGGEAGGLVW